jgi:dipeptide/tripeptide permease
MAARDEPSAVRGKATGIFTGGIDTGTFAGSLILGYIGDWFGLEALFLCAGVSMARALVLFRYRTARTRA